MGEAAGSSLENARRLIVAGLRSHGPAIEQAIRDRIRDAIPHPAGNENPDYEAGLLEAIAAIVNYSFDAIEHGPEWSGQIPPAAIAQARRAARVGVGVGTVQRRYFAGHRELGTFVSQEIERNGLSNNGQVIHHLRTTQEALLEHLTAAIEREYSQEQELIAGSHRCAVVEKLLSGEQPDPAELTELEYEIDTAWHIGLIASGAGADQIVRTLRERYTRRLLCVTLNGRVWAWLSVQNARTDEVDHLSTNGDGEMLLAVGEPGRGLDGWRLTHNQARAAFAIALRKPCNIARYAENRLLAAALQNDTLTSSLTQKYLLPLRGQTDGGTKLRRTLRTYIELECNATSASHRLKVGRHTVESHVHTVEQLIGCSIRECLPELDVALRLEELSHAIPIAERAQA